MAKKKKSILPGLEIMIIIVFFISFMLFAIPRCNKKQMEYASTNAADTPTTTDQIEDSAILNKLVLFEEVHFLNEITPFTEQISLGTTVADEPWIKVQTKRGGEGWVYGAGVYYYKRKYPGMDQ